jgi:hypothetical protein
MQNGIYKVEFQTPLGAGAGVVILQSGKLSGGDSGMYYTGSYAETGDDFTAKVEGRRHTNAPGFSSVFGVDHTHISLKGKSTGNSATMSGTAAEAPSIAFQAKLSKLPE